MKLAIFDIDGTLVAGSTERRFWRYLARRGQQGPRQMLAYLLFFARHVARFQADTLKKNKAYLAGLEVERVRELATRFVHDEIVPRLFAPTLQRLERHRRSGDTIVLISGTLEPIARALAEVLEVEHVSATICGEHDGRYTAEPPTLHPFGALKLEIAARFAASLGATLAEASAYGDSSHDLELLKAVGNPVAVLPDAPLLATARGKRWDILASQ